MWWKEAECCRPEGETGAGKKGEITDVPQYVDSQRRVGIVSEIFRVTRDGGIGGCLRPSFKHAV